MLKLNQVKFSWENNLFFSDKIGASKITKYLLMLVIEHFKSFAILGLKFCKRAHLHKVFCADFSEISSNFLMSLLILLLFFIRTDYPV